MTANIMQIPKIKIVGELMLISVEELMLISLSFSELMTFTGSRDASAYKLNSTPCMTYG
jgi:hypothetical protein